MLEGLCASSRRCLLQSCASDVSSLMNNGYTFRHETTKSFRHETTKSKIITKFTGLRNVILLSRLSALQLAWDQAP